MRVPAKALGLPGRLPSNRGAKFDEPVDIDLEAGKRIFHFAPYSRAFVPQIPVLEPAIHSRSARSGQNRVEGGSLPRDSALEFTNRLMTEDDPETLSLISSYHGP